MGWSKTVSIFVCLLLPLVCESLESTHIAYVISSTTENGGRNLEVGWRDVTDEAGDNTVRELFHQENVTAVGAYKNDINSTGWATLEIRTKASLPNEVQAESAGLAEGWLTAQLISLHYSNVIAPFCNGRAATCANISRFLKKNFQWLKSMWEKHEQTDPYWHQVHLFYIQLAGITKGILARQPHSRLPWNAILWLNGQGDIDELADILKSPEDLVPRERVLGSGSCSALIKVTENASDLLFAHTTWTSYETMLRVQKRYILPYRPTPTRTSSEDIISGSDMSFSSYPGTLTSGDDFYVISSGLATMETTIGNENRSLWEFVKPTTVPEGVRTMVANRLSNTGKAWTTIFAKYNSGTYNNQWMVVDYKVFGRTRGHGVNNLQPGLLWVAEQVPGFVVSGDRTLVLKNTTYWASYNVAYFPFIFSISGSEQQVQKYGDWFSHDRSPRALIFRRDQGGVTNETTMLQLMRFNDYLNDPLSACPGNCTPSRNAENTIAARSDLNPANGTYPWGALGHRNHGATDAKVTSAGLAAQLRFLAESGPTRYSPSCPPFSWKTADFASTTPHNGLPIEWKFEPITHEWYWKTFRRGRDGSSGF